MSLLDHYMQTLLGDLTRQGGRGAGGGATYMTPLNTQQSQTDWFRRQSENSVRANSCHSFHHVPAHYCRCIHGDSCAYQIRGASWIITAACHYCPSSLLLLLYDGRVGYTYRSALLAPVPPSLCRNPLTHFFSPDPNGK